MDVGGIDGNKLREFVERIENLEEEIINLNADKAQVYRDVKAAGLKPKIVRKQISRRRNPSETAADDAELDLYESALETGGKPSRARTREAATDAPSAGLAADALSAYGT